jgi:hypothetical protein
MCARGFVPSLENYKLEAPRSLYSSPGYNNNMSIKLYSFGKKITNVALVIADPFSKNL